MPTFQAGGLKIIDSMGETCRDGKTDRTSWTLCVRSGFGSCTFVDDNNLTDVSANDETDSTIANIAFNCVTFVRGCTVLATRYNSPDAYLYFSIYK